MGRVYRVKDKTLDEEMALKVLKPEIAADKDIIERFKNELKFARKIAHRHVCKMYDLNEEEETPYITMEYVKGEDLKSFIRKKARLKEEEVIVLAKQVCEGLAEAHELGVVHRDLKPQNIMMDEKSNAKVMDFGIARSVEAPGVTQSGVMIGTPDYMSPEQAEGEEADQRSDIYALGVILYEMVTGSVPFKGDTAFSVALKHKSKLPQDPKKLNPDISDELSRLILICMEKERERRYQTAETLRADLRNIEEGLPLGTKLRPRRKTFATALIRKKLFIPALVVLLAIFVLIVWQVLFENKSISAVGVLPFEDLSPQKDQGWFCDGLAEELISRLTGIENLKVPARTSSFSFRGEELNPQKIGTELGVDALVEGSLRKAGKKLRFTVRLVNVSDGYPLWTEEYERNEEDIFALQDEISLAIVDNLKVKILSKEKENLVRHYTEDYEAYNLYLQGRFFWNKRTEEGMNKSIEYFENAIKIDPSYALAYSGLADSYHILSSSGFLAPSQGFPKAKEAALKALSIDDTLAEAYTSLARIKHVFDWDWSGAERDFIKAIELNNCYMSALQWYSTFLSHMGRHDEGIKMIIKALELDPLSILQNRSLGRRYRRARLYDKAIEALQKTLEMDPDFPATRRELGKAYLYKSMYEEALEEFQKVNSQFYIALTYIKMGSDERAKDLLDRWTDESKENNISFSSIAELCFALGENDKGFEWLQKAYEERDANLFKIKINPNFDTVRSDPRFKEILKKMNLE